MKIVRNSNLKYLLVKSMKFFLLSAATTVFVALIIYFINPDLKEVMGEIKNSAPGHIKDSEGIQKVWSYFIHNGISVPFQMFVLAFIPIPFLYLLNIFSTCALLGIFLGIALRADAKLGFHLFISSIPHSIVEIFAYCLFAAVLSEMNQTIRIGIKNLFKKNKEEMVQMDGFVNVIRVYVILVIPFIVAAAFLETYFADVVFNLLQY